MGAIHGFQFHAGFSAIHCGHETPALTLGFQQASASLKVGVELGQTLPKLVERALEIIVGHKEMLFHIGLFHAVACLAG